MSCGCSQNSFINKKAPFMQPNFLTSSVEPTLAPPFLPSLKNPADRLRVCDFPPPAPFFEEPPMYGPEGGFGGGFMPRKPMFPKRKKNFREFPDTYVEQQKSSQATVIFPGYHLKRGSTGDIVKALQEKLGIKPDGVYGPVTEEVVKEFQSKHKLKSVGKVGPKTWQKIFGPSAFPKGSSVFNDTEDEVVVFWTAHKCKGRVYGVKNVCHYSLVLPQKSAEYEFEDRTTNRRIGIIKDGQYASLPLLGTDGKHQFKVSSLKKNAQHPVKPPAGKRGRKRRGLSGIGDALDIVKRFSGFF